MSKRQETNGLACKSCDAALAPNGYLWVTAHDNLTYRTLPFCGGTCRVRYLTSLEKTAYQHLTPSGAPKYPEYLDELRDWNSGNPNPLQARPRPNQNLMFARMPPSTGKEALLDVFAESGSLRCPDLL